MTLFLRVVWKAARSIRWLVLLQFRSRGRAFAFYLVAPWFSVLHSVYIAPFSVLAIMVVRPR